MNSYSSQLLWQQMVNPAETLVLAKVLELHALLSTVPYSSEEWRLLTCAVALLLHAQCDTPPRSPGVPYVIHPILVALRVVKWGYTDYPIVAAALLHDVIEDAPEKVREAYWVDDTLDCSPLEILSEYFGPEVAEAVEEVTNPDFDRITRALQVPSDAMSTVKRALYAAHVIGTIERGHNGAVVKMADFWENGFSLHLMDASPRRAKLQNKYGAVVRLLAESVPRWAQSHSLFAMREVIADETRAQWDFFFPEESTS